jgi:hypothetical protein
VRKRAPTGCFGSKRTLSEEEQHTDFALSAYRLTLTQSRSRRGRRGRTPGGSIARERKKREPAEEQERKACTGTETHHGAVAQY